MSTDTVTGNKRTDRSLLYSVGRSLVTQYWVFTVYVLSYATVGYALGAAVTGFEPAVYAGAMVALWFGLEGLHAVDLSDESVALRTNGTISRVLGYGQVALGAGIGIWLAAQTTWLFLLFAGAAMFFGLAYNEEWFNGILHDDDKLTGVLNFGFAWGVIPVVGGYYLATQSVTLGIVLVSLGVMLDAMRVILLFESGKPAPYDDLDIIYDRSYEANIQMVRETTHLGNKLSTASWAFLAAGMMLLFVV
jgi:hypothetical protein